MTQEENDMPNVLPEAHELVGCYEGLEMTDQAEVERMERLDTVIQRHSTILDTLLTVMSSNETFMLGFLSNSDDRRNMIQVQATVLQHLGLLRDDMKLLRQAINEIHVSNRQVLRNTAGAMVLGITTYMALETPEQDLSPDLKLPAIDILNPVLPRDPRLYSNRNMPRSDDSSVPSFMNNNAQDVRYDPNGGLQMATV
jgi:hypothetical protein